MLPVEKTCSAREESSFKTEMNEALISGPGFSRKTRASALALSSPEGKNSVRAYDSKASEERLSSSSTLSASSESASFAAEETSPCEAKEEILAEPLLNFPERMENLSRKFFAFAP